MTERKWYNLRILEGEEGIIQVKDDKHNIISDQYDEITTLGQYLMAFYWNTKLKRQEVDIYNIDGIYLWGVLKEKTDEYVIIIANPEENYLLLKSSLYISKDIKAIKNDRGEVLGFILLDDEGTISVMNTKGEINDCKIKKNLRKIVFRKESSKIFIQCGRLLTYVFMIYGENGESYDFAKVKITYICGISIKMLSDCIYTPYVRIKRNNMNGETTTWSLYNINDDKIVIRDLKFKPYVELTKTEIRLYTMIEERKLFLKVYDKEYKCILNTYLQNLETVCKDSWMGKDLLSGEYFLVGSFNACSPIVGSNNTCYTIRLKKRIGDFQRQENYILDKMNAKLYYVEGTRYVAYGDITMPLDENIRLIANSRFAIVYGEHYGKFSIYDYGSCILENKRYKGDISSINVDNLCYIQKYNVLLRKIITYLVLPNGKKYKIKYE